MFKLYNLPGSTLLPQQCAVENDRREHYLIHGIAFPPQPMLLLRQILAQSLPRLSDDVRQHITEHHRLLLASVFGKTNVAETTHPHDLQQLRRLTARLESNLTHNMAASCYLITESIALLEQLLKGRSVRIAISDYSRLDDMSTRLMIELIKRQQSLDIHWVVGLPETYHTMPRIEVHGQGIEWLPPLSSHRNNLRGLKASIPFSEHTITAEQSDGSDDDAWEHLSLADEDLAWDERAIFVIYPQSAPTEDEWFVLYSAACQAFQLFAFASALFFAQHAIAMGRGMLSAQRRATLHGICAVAAHNRQFFADNDDGIARYILNQLKQAIALEEQPTVRCAHWYRLAVTEGRRLGHFGRALAYVADGFAEIGRGRLSRQESLLAEAWLYNIKGYCQQRQHEPAEAEKSMTLSYKILEGVDFSNTGLEDEARLTLAVTVENTMTLMRRLARTEQWQQLQETAEALSSPWPIFNPVNHAERADLAIFQLDLRTAIECANSGIQSSIVQCSPSHRLYFTTLLGELYSRVGLWSAAVTAFEQALELPNALDRRSQRPNLPLLLASARAKIYTGMHTEAAQMIEQCLQLSDDVGTEAASIQLKDSDRIHLLCLQLKIAHKENQEDRLQQLCDELTTIVKRAPELSHLTAVNAYIATIAHLRGETQLAQTTADNSWQHAQVLLNALCENKLQPSTHILDALFKAFLHPTRLPQHEIAVWHQAFELIANTLRSHTVPWLYLDRFVLEARQHQRESLLETPNGQCVLRAQSIRRECQSYFGPSGNPGSGRSRPEPMEPLTA